MGVYGRSMVKMAAESNMDFNQDAILASALNQDSIPFQSGAINSMSGMITAGRSLGIGSPSGTILPGNASITSTPRFAASGNSSGGLLLDKMPGLKHDTGMAVDWSIEEQSKLDEGLVKYADEPNIMKYIKIAALLRDKTVRDVALRSQWIMKKENGKRRKHEEYNIGKKMKEWRENIVEASSKTNTPLALQLNRTKYSLMKNQMDQSNRISHEVTAVGGTAKHLLDENARIFSQISANLSMHKLRDNINLFYYTRKNITTILTIMRNMPGIMGQMPPLPVSINEELANSILPDTAQYLQRKIISMPSAVPLRQEPRC